MPGESVPATQLLTGPQIWEQVLKVIATAQHEVTLVSPYNHKLDALVTELKKVRSRKKVKIVRYYRKEETDPAEHLDGISTYAVPNLHAKIYANEHMALITSLNLTYGSVVDNLEVGLLIRDTNLVGEINDYIKTFRKGGNRSRGSVRLSKPQSTEEMRVAAW